MALYDLIIIGGGPTGINCGISAEKAGLRYLILEKGMLVNSIYHFPSNMTFFSTSKLLEIAGMPFISHGDKPTRREALEYYRRVREIFGLRMRFYEEVLGMSRRPNGSYEVRSDKNRYLTHSVVVATGFYDTPNPLDVPGEALPKVKHYYDDAHPYVGQRLLVVGAANSACDAALEAWQKGAEVSMAIRGDAISPRVKYWIKPNIENRIKEGSIKAFFNTRIKEIRPQEVILQGPEGLFPIENDFVLAMTGYLPNFDLLGRLGLATAEDCDRIPIHDPENLLTNLSNVYLAGVVCGGTRTSKFFIENTRDHGEIIVRQVVQKLGREHL
jgi:thioredoxin reductase (NADPH)